MSDRVLVAAVVLLVAACASPVPPAPTPVSTPAPAAPSPSPRSDFPEPRERLAGVTVYDAQQRRLAPCDPTYRPTLAPRRDAQPVESGSVDLAVVGQLGGRPHAATMVGDRLYVGIGPRVVVFQTIPVWRQAVQSSMLPGIVQGLAAQEEVVVAAVGDAGIAVLETPTDSLTVAATLQLDGTARAVAIDGNTAYVAGQSSGVHIVDMADPSEPQAVGILFAGHDVLGVAATQGTVLAAAGSGGLLVADVSDPQAPRALGSLVTGGYAFSVEVVGSTAYLADGWGGLRTIDVSDPSEPKVLGTLPTAGWAWHVAVVDDFAYVAAGSQGLVVADVTRPEEPSATGIVPLARGQAIHVTASDEVAYVVDPFEGLQIIDVASRASPRPIGTWQPLLEGWGVALVGERAYVAAGRAGLRAVDISEPARPSDVDALPTVAMANAVSAYETNMLASTLYDAGSDEVPALIDVDISDLMRARSAYGQLGRYGRTPLPDGEVLGGSGAGVAPPGPAIGLGTSGSVHVYANEWGILIVDAGGPAPCELAFVETQSTVGFAHGVAVNGDVAFIGVNEPSVLALDISDPRDPRVLSRVRAWEDQGLVNGRWLYAVGYGLEYEGYVLTVLDVADPSRPRQLGALDLPAQPPYFSTQPMAFAAGRLFIAAAEAGLLAVDVSDPTQPRLAGQLAVPGQALIVTAVDDYLYVGSDEAGLLVIQVGSGGGGSPPSGEPAVTQWSGLAAAIDRPAVAIAPATSPTPASGCVVTTTEDDGPGSLRDCLYGRVRPGQAVTFDPALFSPERPAAIELRSPLVLRAGGITVDGGGGVILEGSAFLGVGDWAGWETSFELIKDGVTLRGLRIQGFRSGLVVESDGNTIEGNVIAGNVDADLYLHGASGNRIVGNFVGVDASGTPLTYDPQANAPGFDIDSGSAMNLIDGNLIGGSVYVADPGSYNNSFVGNRIGVDAQGQPAPAPCGAAPYCQLVLDEPFNRAGGLLPGDGNIVAWRIVGRAGGVVLGNEIVNPE